jgi:hypothetical protein
LVEVGVPINDDSVSRVRLFLKALLPGIHEGRRWWFSKKVQKQKKKGLLDDKRIRTFRNFFSRTSFFFKINS